MRPLTRSVATATRSSRCEKPWGTKPLGCPLRKPAGEEVEIVLEWAVVSSSMGWDEPGCGGRHVRQGTCQAARVGGLVDRGAEQQVDAGVEVHGGNVPVRYGMVLENQRPL